MNASEKIMVKAAETKMWAVIAERLDEDERQLKAANVGYTEAIAAMDEDEKRYAYQVSELKANTYQLEAIENIRTIILKTIG